MCSFNVLLFQTNLLHTLHWKAASFTCDLISVPTDPYFFNNFYCTHCIWQHQSSLKYCDYLPSKINHRHRLSADIMGPSRFLITSPFGFKWFNLVLANFSTFYPADELELVVEFGQTEMKYDEALEVDLVVKWEFLE